MQSEKNFSVGYRLEDYPRPSVTADVVAFMVRSQARENYKKNSETRLSILLIKRGGHPFRGCWALPGGFLQPGETLEECALREATEETSVTPASLMPVGVFSDPGRDPRGWVISGAYASIISEESVRQVGGDDASDAQWFDVTFERGGAGECRLELCCGEIRICAALKEKATRFGRTDYTIRDSGGLAFDHAAIIAAALTVLREGAKDFDTIFDFLPEKFTLSALQKVQETIMNITILPASFRRKIGEYVVETDEFTQGDGHRPARLYRKKTDSGS
ncbi:MAG: NUDIX hydrolase [Clostridia bacterium]|nr:NUDIX hydrolase [Clostridia bacterium]